MTEQLHFDFSLSCVGEGNGNPRSVLSWRILGTGKPGGLQSMGSHRVGHDWSDLVAAAAAVLKIRSLKSDLFRSHLISVVLAVLIKHLHCLPGILLGTETFCFFPLKMFFMAFFPVLTGTIKGKALNTSCLSYHSHSPRGLQGLSLVLFILCMYDLILDCKCFESFFLSSLCGYGCLR